MANVLKRIDKDLAKEIEKLRTSMEENGSDISFPQASKMFYRQYIKKKYKVTEKSIYPRF